MSTPSFGFRAFVAATHTHHAAIYFRGRMLFQLRCGRTVAYKFWRSQRSDHEPANDL